MSVADKMADQFVPEVDPNPAEPRMVIWSTLRCLELQIDQHEELYDSHGVVSWELLKHMVRLAKRHAHEEGNKIEAAERETDQWRTRADEANAKLREAEQELQRLRQQHVEVQSEELDAARAEVEALKTQLENAQRELSEQSMVANVETQQDAAAWQQQVDSANAEVANLRQELADAQQQHVNAVDDYEGQIAAAEALIDPEANGETTIAAMADMILHLRRQLYAGTEPTAVAEPALCPERELSEEMQDAVPPAWAPLVWDLRRRLRDARQELGRELLDAELRGRELERLRRVVDKVRQMLFKPNRDIEYGDINGLRAALAELDAGTEPTLCPECEPLQAEIERLRAFVGQVRQAMWPEDLQSALKTLDAGNSSALLTSSVVKESLSTDAEGVK